MGNILRENKHPKGIKNWTLETDQLQVELFYNLCDKCKILSHHENSENPQGGEFIYISMCKNYDNIEPHPYDYGCYFLLLLQKYLANTDMWPRKHNNRREILVNPHISRKNKSYEESVLNNESVVNSITLDYQYPNLIVKMIPKVK